MRRFILKNIEDNMSLEEARHGWGVAFACGLVALELFTAFDNVMILQSISELECV